MTRRTRNLVAVGAAGFVVLFVAAQALTDSSSPTERSHSPRSSERVPAPRPRPSPDRPPGTYSYALSAPEVDGLPPDTRPGDLFELWALWEPPITKRPRLQRIVDQVVVKAYVSNIDPQGPPTVIFWVKGAAIDELIYAERYGSLSVVSIAGGSR